MDSNYYDWLAGLKEGDTVFYASDSNSVKVPRKVVKVTNTMIIVEIGKNLEGVAYTDRFRKKNGNKVGGGDWSRSSIFPPTDELYKTYKTTILKNKVLKAMKEIDLSGKDQTWLENFLNVIAPFIAKEN
ncbi:MAG: hypothetical protein WC119_00890 [Synergistaceae bacterium]